MSSSLTLGAEEELHLVDLSTWRLCARAPQVLAQLPNSNFKAELQRSTVETNTEVVETLADLRSELLAKRRRVIDAASPLDVGIAAVGTAPRSDFGRDFELTTNGRFARMQEQYRLLVDEMLDDLVATGVVSDRKMAYFDVRPSAAGPTVELRVCDGCPIVDDVVLIAGLFRAMVLAANQDIEAGVGYQPRAGPLYRAAIWQAARGGLSGRLLDATARARPNDAASVIRNSVQRLRPQLEELGDWAEIERLTEMVLVRGNSADRQRAAFAEGGDLDDVMQLVVEETSASASGPQPDSPIIPGYRLRAGDEAILRTGEPRPTYQSIMQWARGQTQDAIRERQSTRDAWVKERGLTFGADASTFAVDLLPRVIHEHEWQKLAEGLTQRARALELFLRDIYSEQRVVHDGIVPAEQITGIPGWRPEATRLPPDALRATIQGFDLVRNEFGGWRVLEDNLRCPSGIAYGTTIREMMDHVVPELPRPAGLVGSRNALDQLRDTLFAGLGPGGTVVLLSSGPDNSAWFEHQTLAEGAGILLAQANDFERLGDIIVHKPTKRNVDVIYVRLDDPLVDERTSDGRTIGADILDVAAAGQVRLVNAPGNGVGDDKAVYTFVPELIRYYLNEHPLLESVPTYRPADPPERHTVLERVGQLVTKPVSGFGGAGVLVGRSASAAEVAERRAAIASDPGAWVAQEVVALSSHPVFEDDGGGGARLAPRHVDLRVFVFLTGTGPGDARIADAALTRVAPPGSLVVNSSRGGGAKDTWIMAGDSV